MDTSGSVNVIGVVALATSSGPVAVLNARRVTPPVVLRLLIGTAAAVVPFAVLFAVLLTTTLYGSKERDWNCVTIAWLVFPPAAEASKLGDTASKLDGDPGALMGALEAAAPGGVTDTAIWMFGELKVTVAAFAGALLLPLLTADCSKLLAAFDARLFVMLVTCASAAGLLVAALLAMVDKALTTDVPVELPPELDALSCTATIDESTVSALVCVLAPMVALPLTTARTPAATVVATDAERVLVFAVTVTRTESAWDCTAGDRVAFGAAVTTARTRDAAVLAAVAERAVPLPVVVLATRPDRTLVWAAASAAPELPASCVVTDATAALTLVPAEVRFTGAAGGRTTVGGLKLLTVTVTPVTPAVVSAAEKLDAKLAGAMFARPVDTALAADALLTAMVNGTDSDVASSIRRVLTTVMPDTFT